MFGYITYPASYSRNCTGCQSREQRCVVSIELTTLVSMHNCLVGYVQLSILESCVALGLINSLKSGASIPPLRPFSPPVSDFPPISEKFSDFLTNFYNLTFSRKISWPSSAKISDELFFSHRPTNFEFPPLFSLFQYISPLFRKNYSFPYFYKFPPLFYANSPAFYILYVYCSPLLWPWCIYASPNARTWRPCLQESTEIRVQT